MPTIPTSFGAIGLEFPSVDMLFKSEINVACLNFSDETKEYHRDTTKNVCTVIEHFDPHYILYLLVTVDLDTEGPEIQIGVNKVELTKGDSLSLKITLSNSYMEKWEENIE
ncbi:Pyruvate kinase isozymes M1/M2 [Cricetulus griseus]|uniref:Pyruvate kinase isozymes M1/M2 n=1 Tax=Cricetulus griseus TaxID=10029 RepID=G3HYJ2_CRIGR|nr:Pyruvate kinase isozymes M1/M2 [Cricetulus griseus]